MSAYLTHAQYVPGIEKIIDIEKIKTVVKVCQLIKNILEFNALVVKPLKEASQIARMNKIVKLAQYAASSTGIVLAFVKPYSPVAGKAHSVVSTLNKGLDLASDSLKLMPPKDKGD